MGVSGGGRGEEAGDHRDHRDGRDQTHCPQALMSSVGESSIVICKTSFLSKFSLTTLYDIMISCHEGDISFRPRTG